MNSGTYPRKTPPPRPAFDQLLGLLRNQVSIRQFAGKAAHWSEGDQQQFVHACRYHKLQALVLQRLVAGGAGAGHPLCVALEPAMSEQQLTRAGVADIEKALEHHFAQAGLTWIALKGLSYEQRYWRNGIARQVRDLDILVPSAALNDAVEILREQGFTPTDAARKAFSSRRRRLEHASCMTRGNIAVDVHWQLRNPGAYRIDYQRIWRQSVPSPSGCGYKRWLSEADDLQFILLSIAQDIQRGACRLKHLLDAGFLLATCHDRLDWDDFLAVRTAERTDGVVLNALDVTRRVLHSQHFPDSAIAFLERHRERLVCQTDRQAEQLLSGPRGNVINQRWFSRCYPELSWRSIVRFADRNILSPGRIPWAMIKGFRRLAG